MKENLGTLSTQYQWLHIFPVLIEAQGTFI